MANHVIRRKKITRIKYSLNIRATRAAFAPVSPPQKVYDILRKVGQTAENYNPRSAYYANRVIVVDKNRRSRLSNSGVNRRNRKETRKHCELKIKREKEKGRGKEEEKIITALEQTGPRLVETQEPHCSSQPAFCLLLAESGEEVEQSARFFHSNDLARRRPQFLF